MEKKINRREHINGEKEFRKENETKTKRERKNEC
jgi:hypothetical protein